KIVVVGDGETGKTCLLAAYATGEFPEEYVPTIFENSLVNTILDGKAVELAIWDSAGQEDYARLRPLSYCNTDAFLLCFDITSAESYENTETK
ncbi:small GTPase superfamily, partial [Blyttiomyces helicus]